MSRSIQTTTWGQAYTADKAIDNNVNTFNHTNANGFEMLQISVPADSLIDQIDITNRLDNNWGEGARLNGAVVSVVDNGIEVWSSFIGGATAGSVHSFDTGGIVGDAVRIKHSNQLLHVAEVDIFGTPTA